MAPIACSRTPKRRLRPGLSASKWSWPLALTSVRLDSDRSAEPPNSSGSVAASAWMASWLALRVATSEPVSQTGSVASQPAGRRPEIRRRSSAASAGYSAA